MISVQRVVDLTRPIEPGIAMWPGTPAPSFETKVTVEENGFFARLWHLWEHTGTHIDAPAHFISGGATVESLPLAGLVCPAVVIDVSDRCEGKPDYAVSTDDVARFEAAHGQVPAGSAVLLHTGWDVLGNDRERYMGPEGDLHFPGSASRPPACSSRTVNPFAYGPPVQITAHVSREGRSRHASPNEFSQTVDLQTEEIVTESGARIPIHSGARLNIYQALDSSRPNPPAPLSMRLFHYGERIRFPAKLKLPRNFHNPGGFDYETYLAENGIAALASAKAEDVDLLPGFTGNRFELWRTNLPDRHFQVPVDRFTAVLCPRAHTNPRQARSATYGADFTLTIPPVRGYVTD